MNTHVLIGADPELFVAKRGEIASAIGFIGGTKEHPRTVTNGALQEDNVLFEFNIEPAHDLNEFRSNIKSVLSQGRDHIKQFELDIANGVSSFIYTEEQLHSFGESAFVFGCDPDYNAWTSQVNPKPSAVDPGLRTAGGHLHIGYSHLQPVDPMLNEDVIRMCDYMLGLPSILLDSDDRRRELYGKAGAFRHKPYGPEYRTLSNFWLFSDELMEWAYANAVKAYLDVGRLEEFTSLVSGDEVQRIINQGDKKAAKAALEVLGVRYA